MLVIVLVSLLSGLGCMDYTITLINLESPLLHLSHVGLIDEEEDYILI